MTMDLKTFLAGQQRNAWLEEPGIDVYVRRTVRFGNRTLDIANLDAHEPGNGAFKAFLARAERLMDGATIYFENVHNGRLAEHLRGRGYSDVEGTDKHAPCLLKNVTV